MLIRFFASTGVRVLEIDTVLQRFCVFVIGILFASLEQHVGIGMLPVTAANRRRNWFGSCLTGAEVGKTRKKNRGASKHSFTIAPEALPIL